jgi:periplasmic divalent cation tolerance protein
MIDYVLVLTTIPDDERALELARTLVDEGLAACVSVSAPARSVYRWQGRIEQDRERQVTIKTSRSRVSELERRLLALHPYEVPELLVVPVESGGAAYLAWLGDALGQG